MIRVSITKNTPKSVVRFCDHSTEVDKPTIAQNRLREILDKLLYAHGLKEIDMDLEVTAEQAIKDWVKEGIPKEIDMSTVPYQKDRQPQMYVAGWNKAIEDIIEALGL